MARSHTPALVLKWGAAITILVSIFGVVMSVLLNMFVLDRFDAYGAVPIPGTRTLHLPAGEVIVSYHATKTRWRGGLPMPDLRLNIEPPDGVADPQIIEDIRGATIFNRDAHRQIWVVRIPVEGDYRIQTSGSGSDATYPRLAFGYNHSVPWLPYLFCFLLVAGFPTLVVGGIWLTRLRRVSHREELKSLAALRDSGALTEEQFRAEENRILGG